MSEENKDEKFKGGSTPRHGGRFANPSAGVSEIDPEDTEEEKEKEKEQ
jgi:hypothetical protein